MTSSKAMIDQSQCSRPGERKGRKPTFLQGALGRASLQRRELPPSCRGRPASPVLGAKAPCGRRRGCAQGRHPRDRRVVKSHCRPESPGPRRERASRRFPRPLPGSAPPPPDETLRGAHGLRHLEPGRPPAWPLLRGGSALSRGPDSYTSDRRTS